MNSSNAATAWSPTRFDDAADIPESTGSFDLPSAWQPPAVEPGVLAARLAVAARRRRSWQGSAAPGDDEAIAEIRRAAFEQGLEEGYRRGKAESRDASARLVEVTRGLAAARTVFLKDLEANATALALAAARHLAGREISADPRLVGELIAKGLPLVKGDAPITIRLNAADLDPLRPSFEANASVEADTLRWIADPEIQPGSFVIETPKRLVNGRIDEALRHLYERLVYE